MLLAVRARDLGFSISDTGDSPCGSIVDPSFGWATYSQCGIVHLGTLGVVGVLTLTGCPLLLFAASSKTRWAVRMLAVVAAVGGIATVALAWRTSTYPEPVLQRGWHSLRNLAAFTTVGIAVALLCAVLIARPNPGDRPA